VSGTGDRDKGQETRRVMIIYLIVYNNSLEGKGKKRALLLYPKVNYKC
jgi:hypothetical protein